MRRSALATGILSTTIVLPAQTWVEAGDAGDLPSSAQAPTGAGPLLQIDGTINDPGIVEGPGNDLDMYLIQDGWNGNHSNFGTGSYSIFLTGATTPPPQTWTEVGDAGDLPGTAQVPSGSGPLSKIDGTFNDPSILGGPGNDRDMYLIQIDDPLAFTAITAAPAFNTQLFLFDTDGFGVSHNDNLMEKVPLCLLDSGTRFPTIPPFCRQSAACHVRVAGPPLPRDPHFPLREEQIK